MKTKNAFTLVEILITIGIIGILVGIILVSLGPQRQRAQNASVTTTVHSAVVAAKVCATDEETISDPSTSVGSPICTNSVGVWPDLTEADAAASWGGCTFAQDSADGTFTFCATLGDATIVTCTETGCV